jgi:hypothetical protein
MHVYDIRLELLMEIEQRDMVSCLYCKGMELPAMVAELAAVDHKYAFDENRVKYWRHHHFRRLRRALRSGFMSVSDVLDGARPTVFRAHKHPISRIRLSPDGAIVATASHKGTIVRLFDCASGRQLGAFRRGAIPGAVVAIGVSQSNQEVVVVSATGTVHFFTVAAAREGGGEPVRAVAKVSIGRVDAADVAFDQYGGIVVIASSGYLFRIKWDAATLEVVEELFVLSH